jgi:hypothetical protein
MVRDANGKIVLVPAPGGKPRVLIEDAFERFQTHVAHSASGPTICDIDGDGENVGVHGPLLRLRPEIATTAA